MGTERRLVWFKPTDLRIHDNPVLTHAHVHSNNCGNNTAPHTSNESYHQLKSFLNNQGKSADKDTTTCQCNINVMHVFVVDPIFTTSKLQHTGLPKMGILRLQHLIQSIDNLQCNLRKMGSELYIMYGNTVELLPSLCHRYHINSIYTSTPYITDESNQYNQLQKQCNEINVKLYSYWMNSMIEQNDCPFDYGDGPNIFTSFRTQIEKNMIVRDWRDNTLIVQNKRLLNNVNVDINDQSISIDIPSINKFNYSQVDIDKQLSLYNQHSNKLIQLGGGESSAINHLHSYIYQQQLPSTYKQTRNGMLATSLFSTQFSSYLSHGTLSARLIYDSIKQYESHYTANDSTYWIIFELLWRDYWRLVIAPKFTHNLFTKYGIQSVLDVKQSSDYIEPGWSTDMNKFAQWCTGHTGHQLVDACMRELNECGWMSNRGRQIVASFLTKDLCIDWRYGAEYFESQLIDYDTASNWGNWQYAAGVGTDPRAGRYFSLYKQAKQYDPQNDYINYWLHNDFVNGQYTVPKICALRFDGSSVHHNNNHKFYKSTTKQNTKYNNKQQSRNYASSAALHNQ